MKMYGIHFGNDLLNRQFVSWCLSGQRVDINIFPIHKALESLGLHVVVGANLDCQCLPLLEKSINCFYINHGCFCVGKWKFMLKTELELGL